MDISFAFASQSEKMLLELVGAQNNSGIEILLFVLTFDSVSI